MPDDTLTLSLGGEVPLPLFVTAIRNLETLVNALAEEVSPSDAIEWTIAGLDYGSATATIQGRARSNELEPVQKVIRAYGEVGKALERGERPSRSIQVVKAANQIARLPDTKIKVVRFITAIDEAEVRPQPALQAPILLRRSAYGSIEGRVQTLSETRGLRFVLYDSLHGLPVSCYLREGDREIMRGAWGRRASVEGWVTRDRTSGVPVSVRQVRSVAVIEGAEPGSYRSARGALPRVQGEPYPEERVRALRDATD